MLKNQFFTVAMETIPIWVIFDPFNNLWIHYFLIKNACGTKIEVIQGQIEPQSARFQIFRFPGQPFQILMNFGKSSPNGLSLCQISSF